MAIAQNIDVLTLIGNSDPMQQLYKTIGRICNVDCPILLVGEKGVGKGIIARALHYFSHRASSPFKILYGSEVKEFPDEELLGVDELHRTESTCYIMDWNLLPLFVHVQLLRIYKTAEYRCSHQERSRKHRFRFIAATSGNLKEDLESGKVPLDLFYDWNFLIVYVPPLRARREDIPLYANHFLGLLSGQMKISQKELSPEAKEVLAAYDWPGNLSELKEALRKGLQSCRGNYVRPEHLPHLKNQIPESSEAITRLETFLHSKLSAYIRSLPSTFDGNLYPLLLPHLEKSLFEHTLRRSKGNKKKAARLLGLHRNTLNKKIHKLEKG